MSKVRTLSFAIGAALILCTLGSDAQAAGAAFHKAPGVDRGAVGRKVRLTAAPVSLTQNVDPNTVEDGLSVACSAGGVTTANTWMRRFRLASSYGINGPFCVTSLDFGVELLTGGTMLTVASHCNPVSSNVPGVILLSDLVLQDSVTFNGTDGSLYFQNTVLGGCCTGATDDLVMEVTGADCLGSGACLQFFIGANDNGQTDPGYLAAADCGIVNPTDIALLGFPDDHIVMTVNGDSEGGGTVPALGPMGVTLLVLALLGGSAFFLRRQVVG
jgi:hypothetical protein